ncbi:methyl-accepting chemotaxis protein [Candidatus Magnetaquicoccus inordinatus]|uniref:methyl-accepting chemotaxis protein n=1 Tax=Candidatus Magnetaquicoccus inordinatus TaxID=2496818 RepID=UPI00102C92DB|nr:methyl-accepting chemotaxis protein [Candidatus Magnetaquicoccus inordinatus]
MLASLRIGIKIGLIITVTTLLFAAVIVLYQLTLSNTLDAYGRLQENTQSQLTGMLTVDHYLLEARRYEKDFLSRRNNDLAEKQRAQLQALLREVEGIRTIRKRFGETVGELDQIMELARAYQEHFQEVVMAWNRKGLTHNDGLQGNFRNSAHRLENVLRAQNNVGLERDLLSLRRHEKDYLLRSDKKYVDLLHKEAGKLGEKINALANVAENDKRQMSEMLASYERDFVALVAVDDQIASKMELLRAKAHQIEPVIKQEVTESKEHAQKAITSTQQEASQRSSIALSIALLATVVSVVTGSLITRKITGPVGELSRFAESIQGGDLRQSIHLPQRDEIGLLGEVMNQMTATLRDLVTRIDHNAEALQGNSSELTGMAGQMSGHSEAMLEQAHSSAAAAQQMSSGMSTVSSAAQQSASNLTTIAAATEEISSTVHAISAATEEVSANLQHISLTAREVNMALRNVAEGAQGTSQNVQTASQSIMQVSSSFSSMRVQSKDADDFSKEADRHVRDSYAVMQKLTHSAGEIGKVVRIIKQIADQTNMLALNAAIEAAGAGEAGKGFAVVANEVKELARQTGEATRTITQRVEEIQHHSGAAMQAAQDVGAMIGRIGKANTDILHSVDTQSEAMESVASLMSAVAREAEESTRQLTESAYGMQDVSRNVAEISLGVAEVSRRVVEANHGVNEITRGVSEVAHGGQEISRSVTDNAQTSQTVAGSMKQITASAAQLQEMSTGLNKRATEMGRMADLLRELMSHFRV